jgi:hypothetical protein
VRGWGDLGLEIENRAVGARFSRMTCAGVCIRVEGTYLGPGKLGFRWWQAKTNRRTRGGDLGLEIENRAAGAWFSRMTCAGVCIRVEGTYLGPGKLGFR